MARATEEDEVGALRNAHPPIARIFRLFGCAEAVPFESSMISISLTPKQRKALVGLAARMAKSGDRREWEVLAILDAADGMTTEAIAKKHGKDVRLISHLKRAFKDQPSTYFNRPRVGGHAKKEMPPMAELVESLNQFQATTEPSLSVQECFLHPAFQTKHFGDDVVSLRTFQRWLKASGYTAKGGTIRLSMPHLDSAPQANPENETTTRQLLMDYIWLGILPPGQKALDSIGDGGENTIHLLVPFERWPRELLKKHGTILYKTFPDKFTNLPPPSERNHYEVCLCAEVPICEFKQSKQVPTLEYSDCQHYYHGLCAAATKAINGGQGIPYAVLSQFSGISVKQLRRIENEEIKKLARELLRDPAIAHR